MKFSHGNWFVEDNISLILPNEMRDYKIIDNKVICYAPANKINHRGDTLNGPMLTYEFSSPMSDVIKVRIFHFKRTNLFGNDFDIVDTNSEKTCIEDREEKIVLRSHKTSVVIKKKGTISYSFSYENSILTKSEPKSSCYAINREDGKSYIREQLSLDIGENVYGLGERFTSFVKNGQVVDMWNEDGGTNSDLAYKNVPFYITNKNYGILVNNSGKVSFEVATQRVDKVQFSVPYEGMEYYIFGGNSMKAVLNSYTLFTGRPPLLPKWSFGLWLSTSFVTDYDEKTVTNFINKMEKNNIPISVFHYDCFWMKEMEFCNFEWNREIFPNPEKMLKHLKEKGIKISVWINPYISQKSQLFDEAGENDYLIKKTNGDIYQKDEWQAGLGIVDFTNPSACEWFQKKLSKLLDMGVDCFKTDFGERIPSQIDDVCFFDKSDPDKMRNKYSFLYNKTVYDIISEKKGEKEALLFARSATACSQRFPIHWSGDCWSTFTAMAENLRAGLSLGLSGFSFWSHDIGGFEDKSSEEIYMRWSAFGLLSSHSRLHGNSSYRVPWNYSERAVKVLSKFTKLKYQLMPYLYFSAYESTEKGLPLLRAMVLEFQDDLTCKHLDLQYMLGEKLLVAPIFNEQCKANYYLPEKRWVNILNNTVYNGKQWIEEKHDYFSIPLLLRENSAIIMGKNENTPEYDYTKAIQVLLFDIQDGYNDTLQVVNSNEEIINCVKITCKNNEILISIDEQVEKLDIVWLGDKKIECRESMNSLDDGRIEIYPSKKIVKIKKKPLLI